MTIKSEWETIIGIEIHAQVISNAKLFSGASTTFGSEPNTQVSLIDVAFPGMLPVINSCCVDQAIRTGLGLNAEINLESVFDRKNYFYPDLPQGYQISQYTRPIVGTGWLNIETKQGETKRIGIQRLHLEQDAGKNLHDLHPAKSYIDLNRCGVALMEIVTEPDMRSSEEAAAFIKKLRSILRYLKTCDGNMEEGSLRADINVSVRRPGEPLGTRAEVKNVNSIRFLAQAIEYEVKRQISVIEEGGTVDQETRLFDSVQGITRSMRSKEDAQDYRYFPDPDLPILRITQERVEFIKASLPELPDSKKKKFKENYDLSDYEIDLIISEPEYAEYFEECISISNGELSQIKLISNWFLVEFFAHINRTNSTVKTSLIRPKHIVELVSLIQNQIISGKIAKEVFTIMEETGEIPGDIVEKHSMKQLIKPEEIRPIVISVLEKESDKVAQYKSGKEKLFGYFVGQVMKASNNKANPDLTNKIILEELTGVS